MSNEKPYERVIQAKIGNVGVVVDDVFEYFNEVYGQIADDVCFELKVALNELLVNAIIHGDRENEEKHVKIEASLADGECAVIVVEDEGEGYCLTRRKTTGVEVDVGADNDAGAEIYAKVNVGANADVTDDAGAETDANADTASNADATATAAADADSADYLEGLSESGRGILLVEHLCDEFIVNQKGNKVTVRKKLR